MSPKDSILTPLKKASEAIKQINDTLSPFLLLLDRYYNQHSQDNDHNNNNNNNNNISSNSSSSSNKKKNNHENEDQTTTNTNNVIDAYQIKEAEAAVALSIGTLRYMAFRLKGQSNGRKKNDPLRMELDKIRKTLVELRQLKKKTKNDVEKKGKGRVGKDNTQGKSCGKKRKKGKNNDDSNYGEEKKGKQSPSKRIKN
mmetsp:Transcript_11997/g.13946  ORF Transcript_11997/g.13946 Transcript_11997/m.13946 type:complete len:198 (+) Transcript_11997:214-807(+)